MRGNFSAEFDPPFRRCDAVAEAGEKFALITQGQHGGRERGGTVMTEERPAQALRALIGEQSENDSRPVHGRAQQGAVGATLKKQAAGTFAQLLHQTVESRLLQRPISRGALIAVRRLMEPCI